MSNERDDAATIAELRAEVERLRGEVAHWEHHAWEAGEGFKRAIEDAVRAHGYKRTAEARVAELEVALQRSRDAHQGAEARLRAVEALADLWEREYPSTRPEVVRDLRAAIVPATSPAEQEGGRG